ncbi:hypothetical protein AB0O10_26720 [Streptomyces lydicus]
MGSLDAAGYTSQAPSDLLAAYGSRELGIPANNLPAQRKKQGRTRRRRFGVRVAVRRYLVRPPGATGPAPGNQHRAAPVRARGQVPTRLSLTAPALLHAVKQARTRSVWVAEGG